MLRDVGQRRQLSGGGERRALARGRAWMLGATLYLPENWLTSAARQNRANGFGVGRPGVIEARTGLGALHDGPDRIC